MTLWDNICLFWHSPSSWRQYNRLRVCGWMLAVKSFDGGTKWGVGIERVREGDGRKVRNAVAPLNAKNEYDAIAQAVPALAAWAETA